MTLNIKLFYRILYFEMKRISYDQFALKNKEKNTGKVLMEKP